MVHFSMKKKQHEHEKIEWQWLYYLSWIGMCAFVCFQWKSLFIIAALVRIVLASQLKELA